MDRHQKQISVAEDFSRTPGPRYIKQGNNSGEKFREKLLVPALDQFDTIVVNLDGTAGYGSSFIDEAFGGLIREHKMSARDIWARIKIISDEEPELKSDVEDAIFGAK